MLEKIAYIGLFVTVSVVSINSHSSIATSNASSRTSSSFSTPAAKRLPKVDTQPMRGGPCLPGMPRC